MVKSAKIRRLGVLQQVNDVHVSFVETMLRISSTVQPLLRTSF